MSSLSEELARRNSVDEETEAAAVTATVTASTDNSISENDNEAKPPAAPSASAPATSATSPDIIVEEAFAAAVASAAAPAAPLNFANHDDWTEVAPPIQNDEVLARAAELIGSALFSSQELDPASKIEASPEQLQRYAFQLAPLIELGFVDRHGMKTVINVLESLTAANIGSGENAEVSVDAVIQELDKAGGGDQA